MLNKILQLCALALPYVSLALLLSLFLTYLLIFFLPRLGFVDIPRGRHQHEKPIPRGGGIAIGSAFLLTVFLLQIFVSAQNTLILPEVETFLQRFIIPAAIILITGIIDDRYELKSWIKLIAQIAAGAILYFEGVGITHIFVYQLPPVLSLIITVFWSVMIINAFNLIDGLDGIAAGLAAISSFLLAIWTLLCGNSNAMFLIQLIFCGCCLGFLRYNFSPAKIFMGDTGSMFLGLFFAYVSMQYSTKSITIAALLVPLAAVGLPMFDVMLAIWRRIFRKYVQKDPNSDIMKGDHDHLHHRILKQSGSTRKTAYIMYFLSLTISIFAMLGAFLESHIPALTFVLLLLALFVMIRYSNIELFDTLTSVATGFHRPHRNFVLTALHPLLDAIIVFVSFWISRIVCKNFLPDPASGLWILSWNAWYSVFVFFRNLPDVLAAGRNNSILQTYPLTDNRRNNRIYYKQFDLYLRL